MYTELDDLDGLSALGLACCHGNIKSVIEFVSLGADPQLACNRSGDKPIELAE